MPANAVKHRFIPMRDAFAPQIGFSCQTHKGATSCDVEYVKMA